MSAPATFALTRRGKNVFGQPHPGAEDTSAQSWSVSLFRTVGTNKPLAREFGLDRLVELLTTFRERGADKKQIPLWSPAEYGAGQTRGAERVLYVSCLVFDVDDGTDYLTARDAFAPWAHIGHTSWSHTPEHPKFRLVLPLAAPVLGDEWYDAWRAARGLWAAMMPPGTEPDLKCKDPSRIYFLPAWRGEGFQHVRWVNEGPLLELRGRVAPPEPPKAANKPWTPTVIPGGRGQAGEGRETIEARRALWEKYRDPSIRRQLGEQLGGKIDHAWVRKVTCPACGRPSLGWALDPSDPERSYLKAMCSHKNSCNHSCFLDELAVLAGLEAAA